MTLRFVVGRILRELIELAEHDADAELVDALHDARDAGGVERKDDVSEPRGPGPWFAGWEHSGGAERQEGAGRDRDCLALWKDA